MGPSGSTGVGGRELAIYTFLFTDVEGSTRRWQVDRDAMPELLAAHDRTLREAVDDRAGRVFKHTGDGICAVFRSVGPAVLAAVDAQRKLELPVRMAIHTGDAVHRDHDFFGVTLNRCARLLEAGHGGQVLVSADSVAVFDPLGTELELRDLGEHRLRDLSERERIFQLVVPDLPQEFPALRSLDAVRHNLPVVRSSFVGREVELIEVSERLARAPLLTLTGIGGCGKTRLGLEAAARLVQRFPRGVFFVDLAVVSDSGLVGQAVSSALELRVPEPGIKALASYLNERQVLIVLDNCEHLLDACAELVDGLLSHCGELHILVTSREPLGVEGEQIFRVPSLDIETDAVRLFIDRAGAAGAQLDPRAHHVIAEICRRLDGIPLAIELAAARSTHLAPAQILERLSNRFHLLTGGRRRVQRQQTLAAAIAWSYDLLPEREQALFSRLAVFRGSFSLEAVEQICDADIDLLGSLVDKSLVNAQPGDPVPRYRLLETVRLYAEERLLNSGEAARLRSAHRDWFLAWVESVPIGQLVELGGGTQLIPEADNLAAALDWSLEQSRLDLTVRMASRMVGYWMSEVRVAEAGTWWRALQRCLADLPVDLRAQAFVVGIEHARTTGDFEQMEKLSAEVLLIAARHSWVAAYAWSTQALYWTYADPERGRHCIEEGRQAAAAAPELERNIILQSANLLTGDAEQDEALGGREILNSLLAEIEHLPPLARYIRSGIIAALGDTDTASRLAASVPATTAHTRFSHEMLDVVIAIREGRTRAAYERLRSVAAIVREYAIPLGEPSCLVGFAALAARTEDFDRASRLLASVKAAGPFPFRTPLEVLLYRQTARAVRGALDPDTAARCRAEGAAVPVTKALDAELARFDAITQPIEPANTPSA